MDIANQTVHRVLVDGERSTNILFRCAFNKLKIDPRQVVKVNFPFIGFNGSSVILDEKITLLVTIGRRQTTRNDLNEYSVVNVPILYDVIINGKITHPQRERRSVNIPPDDVICIRYWNPRKIVMQPRIGSPM